MKVTIDVPAPTQLLELVSRLRRKNRNYKTQLKQLGKAHYITKMLYKEQMQNHLVLLERLGRMQSELSTAQQELRETRCFLPPMRIERIEKQDEDVVLHEAYFDHP